MLFVRLSLSTPAGRIRLSQQDLALDGINPEVWKLGAKLLIPKAWTDRFNSVCHRARSAVKTWSHTTDDAPWGANYRAIKPEVVGRLEEDLAPLAKEFEANRAAFLLDLDAITETQREAWVEQAEHIGTSRIERGEDLDLEELKAQVAAAYDTAWARRGTRIKNSFAWDLLYVEIGPPGESVLARSFSSEGIQVALEKAREAFEADLEATRHAITQSIRAGVLARLQSVGEKLDEAKAGGKGLTATTLKSLASELEVARLTNPFGDPEVEAWCAEFEKEWLGGKNLRELAKEARDDEAISLELKSAALKLTGHLETAIEESEEAFAKRIVGAGELEGRRRVG